MALPYLAWPFNTHLPLVAAILPFGGECYWLPNMEVARAGFTEFSDLMKAGVLWNQK